MPVLRSKLAFSSYFEGHFAITPFGSTRAWPVLADAAILGQSVVAIGGGARGVNLHLAPSDLVAALDATVLDVSIADEAAS